MKALHETIRRFLQDNADEKSRESSQRFFKEPIKSYGVPSAQVRQIIRQALAVSKARSKEEVFSLCEDLWRSGFFEEGGIACELAYARRGQFAADDFRIFERWLDDYVSNWAACDTLCNHSVAACIERYPEWIEALKSWTGAENRWKRRAAAVTLIIPARRGLFLQDILIIAERLLMDPDDLVQKGYGWMLKAASEAHPEEVFQYLMSRKTVMPRTAFRYALEKMPKEWRTEAMKK